MKKKIFKIIAFFLIFLCTSIEVNASVYYPVIEEFKDDTAYDNMGSIISNTWAYTYKDGIPDKFYKLNEKGQISEESESAPISNNNGEIEGKDIKTGWIEFVSEGLEDFEYTITVQLINVDNGEIYVMNLYKDNDFIAHSRFPVGNYMVSSVGVENDFKGEYLFDFPFNIDVKDSITATQLLIKRKVGAETIVQEESTSKVKEEIINEDNKTINWNTVFLIVLLVVVTIGFYIYKKNIL